MEWTKLHGQVLGRAFANVLGQAERGTMAFVRCLTPDVVESWLRTTPLTCGIGKS